MAPDQSMQGQEAPGRRRRGRPPGAKSTAPGTRRKRIGGSDLVEQLNSMIAELIKENRKLKRQVIKLTATGSTTASKAVERSLRTIQRRVQRALTAPKRRRRKTATAPGRKKVQTRKRRKAG
jgi:hypothetical protein